MKKIHNAYFRHNVSDTVIILVYEAEPITDTRAYGERDIQEAECIAIDAELMMNASLCAIVEL